MKRMVPALAAFVLVGCGQQSSPQIPTADPAATTAHGPRAIALRAVTRVLAAAPLPSGTRVATAQEGAGKKIQSRPMDKNLVDRHTVHVVPLGFEDAIAWFTDHPPPHLTSAGSSSAGGPDGAMSAGVEYDGADTPAYHELDEQVAVFPLDTDHAVVRVDALAVWWSRPTADERVPQAATAVHVVRVDHAGATPRRYTLTGPAVHRLARVVNQQHPVTFFAASCGNDNGAYDVLHFTGATPDPRFRVAPAGCSVIGVTTDGVRQPTLNGGFALDLSLRAVLAHLA